jgi:hypothetical protein
MNRPVAVRIGIALLVLALIVRAAALVAFIPQTSRFQGTTTSGAGAVVSLLFYAAFVYAMAQRRNWARVVFAFLYVTAAMLTIFFALANGRLSEFANPLGELMGPQLVLLSLVGVAMVCLFLPSAADWYHRRDRSSLTSA